jgi:hypothetical protein
MRTIYILIVLVLLAVAVPAAPAQAGGVVTVCDEAHLLTALAGGGTVTFTCSGTIVLTATITIAADTAVDGSGQSVTISGNNLVRVFAVNSGVTLSLDRLTVANGHSYSDGGAGIANSGGTVIVNNSVLFNNFDASMYSSMGGGISNSGGTVIASNSIFSNNRTSWEGGGIGNSVGTVTVSNCLFVGNSAMDGGAIATDGGTVEVSRSAFSGNLAYGWGGGIWNYYAGVTVVDSTFVDNNAEYGGGVGTSWDAILSVTNSSFFQNNADDYSGGIFNGGTGTISNCTFNNNGASYAGGGITNGSGSMLTLRNTIIANSPTGGNCYGVLIDGGGNLSYPDTTCPGINADPMLGPLQDNGGPTRTMALRAGSAAIDAADDAICAADPVNNRDQRGIARPQGPHCDIGAVEQVSIKSIWLPAVQAW